MNQGWSLPLGNLSPTFRKGFTDHWAILMPRGQADGYERTVVKQIWLKKIRVVVSLVYLILLTLLFVDFDWIGETPIASVLLYPQFVPSLLKFTQTLAWGATGFLAVLALTLLFGRVYCSMLCPLGTLQDIAIRIARKLRWPRRVKFLFQPPNNMLRYGMLVLAVGLFLSGSVVGLALLDPFSNYGRIAADLLRPLYVFAHNGLGQLLESCGINGPLPLQWKPPSVAALVFPAAFLIGLLWLSATRGRLFCNTLCPVGTLLGLVARVALFKIKIPQSACIVCAQCSIHCKAGCIRLKTKEVDFSRCVACYNCITVCEAHGIGYGSPQPINFYSSPPNSLLPSKPQPGNDRVVPNHLQREAAPTGTGTMDGRVASPARRTVLRSLGWVITLGLVQRNGLAVKPHNRLPSQVANPKTWPVAPPGAEQLSRFNDLCTACHLCVSACPYGVLQPALLEYGLSGLLQPRLDYEAGYCSYECNRCGQICPTGAIRPLDLASKQTVQMGVSRFVRDNCIVYTDHVACGVCADYCPTKAVHLLSYQYGLMIPEVRENLCVGCGACENACPVRPYRAIYVDGHLIQRKAQRPFSKSPEQEV